MLRHRPSLNAAMRRLRAAHRARAAAVAGSLLVLAGAAILMGIITAEALFPADYSTGQNAISDLGSTFQPGDEVRQPSAAIFNTTMIVSDLLIAAASLGVARALPGVALPALIALLAFVSGGVAAILAGRVTRPPFRYLSVLLGVLALLSLVLSGWLADTRLGEGGIERWVAYPTVIWVIAFGGYLLGTAGPAEERPHPPAL